MKRVFVIILSTVLAILMTVLAVSAATVDMIDVGKTVITHGDWKLEKINNDTQWNLDSYIGEETNVVAPRIISDMLVVSFGNHCFANNTTIRSVVTSSPLWTVGEYAFINCTSLESFECNYALNTIKTGAFSGTSSLKSINLESSVVTEIMPYTFLNSGIDEIALPETCTKLSANSFAQCYELSKITIPASVTQIADTAFAGCDDLTIYCYTDSYAHSYAEDNGIEYVLLDAVQPTEEPTEAPTDEPTVEPTEEPTEAPTDEPTEAPTEKHIYTFVLGDADGDGHANIIDATFAQRIATGLRTDSDGSWTMRADVDRSGAVEVTDATFIQRFDVGLIVPYQIGQQITIEMYF